MTLDQAAKIFGINPAKDISDKQLQKRWHRLLKDNHPNYNNNSRDSNRKSQNINEAYETLKSVNHIKSEDFYAGSTSYSEPTEEEKRRGWQAQQDERKAWNERQTERNRRAADFERQESQRQRDFRQEMRDAEMRQRMEKNAEETLREQKERERLNTEPKRRKSEADEKKLYDYFEQEADETEKAFYDKINPTLTVENNYVKRQDRVGYSANAEAKKYNDDKPWWKRKKKKQDFMD